MVSFTGESFRAVLAKHGVSQNELARRMGINATSISRIANSQVSPSIGTLEKIAKAVPCDIREFFGGVPESPEARTKDIVISTPRSIRQAFQEDEGEQNFVPVPLLSDPLSLGSGLAVNEAERDGWALLHSKWLKPSMKVYAVWVKGDSMEPLLSDGDMVAVDIKQTDPKRLEGKLVAYKIKDEVGIKRLIDRHDSWYFQAENRDYEIEHGQITSKKKDGIIIGKVIFCWRRFE